MKIAETCPELLTAWQEGQLAVGGRGVPVAVAG